MSLSHRKRVRADGKASPAGDFYCPNCGVKSLRRSQGNCKLLDGTVVKNLSRLHCFNCGEDFFDWEAMGEIRKQRGKKVKS